MAKRSASIYDIARLAGVSTATVSNVLNQKGSYSEKTRELVERVAREQGYVANFAAKSLRRSSTGTVGLITPDVSNDFFSTIVLKVEGMLREAGYASYICNSANDAERESEYVRSLLSKQVDGLVYIGGLSAAPIEAQVDLPVVHVDHVGSAGVRREVVVRNDAIRVLQDMVGTLYERGSRNIGCVSVSATFYRTGSGQVELVERFRNCLAGLGLRLDKNLVLQGSHAQKSYEEAERLVGECLDEGHELDGLVCLGDRVALGAVRALAARGVAVGRDVRVIGMDDSVYSRISTPPISTVRRNTSRLAQEATDALLAMLGGADPATTDVVVPHEVVERATTLGPQDLHFQATS